MTEEPPDSGHLPGCTRASCKGCAPPQRTNYGSGYELDCGPACGFGIGECRCVNMRDATPVTRSRAPRLFTLLRGFFTRKVQP